MNPPNKFAPLILTNGRPDRVITVQTLTRHGYSGPIYLVVDDLDPTLKDYQEKFGDSVIVFDKNKAAKETNAQDNFSDMRTALYAYNKSFDVAKNLGLKHFMILDDDYTDFQFRFDRKFNYQWAHVTDLDGVFTEMIAFLEKTGASALALGQGGDFIGGSDSFAAERVRLTRKCMNSFLCAVDRKFPFSGRLNCDVNAYVGHGSVGKLFFTTNQVILNQKETQSNAGGMTDIYRSMGTYVKSFYTVMLQPSSVKIGMIRGQQSSRIHHSIDWRCTVPKILAESFRK